MPEAAVRDLVEWPFRPNAEGELDFVLQKEISISKLLDSDPHQPAMRDDHPVNEYVILRRLQNSGFRKMPWSPGMNTPRNRDTCWHNPE